MPCSGRNVAGQRVVVGLDLASRTWGDVGSAILSFTPGAAAVWQDCRTDIIRWPDGPLTPPALVASLDQFAREVGANAVSIDGPQGWRNPHAALRKGVGRWCEYEARTPGKTGVFGRVFPSTYLGWVAFSIAVFDGLLALPHVTLVNDPTAPPLDPLPAQHYYVLECFPTSTWRSSGLGPLPGHQKAPPPIVSTHAEALQQHYNLPPTVLTDRHDHLQAVVAALPAAGLLGGPCMIIARGEPARDEPAFPEAPEHRTEGLIWDAAPLGWDPGVRMSLGGMTGVVVVGSTSYAEAGRDPAVRRTPLAQSRVVTARECLCGCGGVPRGGQFLPGHDAKLKSALRRRARGGDATALGELERRGWR